MKISTTLGNILKGLLSGLASFLAVYGTYIIQGIPAHISTMTIGGIITAIVATFVHAYATPAGSQVTPPHA